MSYKGTVTIFKGIDPKDIDEVREFIHLTKKQAEYLDRVIGGYRRQSSNTREGFREWAMERAIASKYWRWKVNGGSGRNKSGSAQRAFR